MAAKEGGYGSDNTRRFTSSPTIQILNLSDALVVSVSPHEESQSCKSTELVVNLDSLNSSKGFSTTSDNTTGANFLHILSGTPQQSLQPLAEGVEPNSIFIPGEFPFLTESSSKDKENIENFKNNKARSYNSDHKGKGIGSS